MWAKKLALKKELGRYERTDATKLYFSQFYREKDAHFCFARRMVYDEKMFSYTGIFLIGSKAFGIDLVTNYVTKLKHNGWEYIVRADENNIVIKQDFNGDIQPEMLLGFKAYCDPKVQAPASFVLLGKEEMGKFVSRYIIKGNDRFRRVELTDIDKDGLDFFE